MIEASPENITKELGHSVNRLVDYQELRALDLVQRKQRLVEFLKPVEHILGY